MVAQRVVKVLHGRDDVEVVVIGTHPRVINSLVSMRTIDCFCFEPLAPDKLLRLRRSIVDSVPATSRVRSAVLVDHADSAFVYHVLGYGVDDVVEMSTDDDAMRRSLLKFVGGAELSCASLLVSSVDLPHAVVRGSIEFADLTDLEIVRLVSVGYTDREICEILHFSHQVIRNRISHILLRSGLRNRTQLGARYTFEAIERGHPTQA